MQSLNPEPYNLDETDVREMAASTGNRGVLVLSRAEGERSEFVVLSLWDSSQTSDEPIGDDSARGIPRSDAGYLIERDLDVIEYSVFIRGELALGIGALD